MDSRDIDDLNEVGHKLKIVPCCVKEFMILGYLL